MKGTKFVMETGFHFEIIHKSLLPMYASRVIAIVQKFDLPHVRLYTCVFKRCEIVLNDGILQLIFGILISIEKF